MNARGKILGYLTPKTSRSSSADRSKTTRSALSKGKRLALTKEKALVITVEKRVATLALTVKKTTRNARAEEKLALTKEEK